MGMVTILKGMNQLNLRLANSILEVSFILNDFIKFRFKSEARVVLDVVPLIFFYYCLQKFHYLLNSKAKRGEENYPFSDELTKGIIL